MSRFELKFLEVSLKTSPIVFAGSYYNKII